MVTEPHISEECPQLRSDVSLVSGFDAVPLLFAERDGRYVRIGRAAVAAVARMDGSLTPVQLGEAVARDLGADPVVVHTHIERLLLALAAAGLLTNAAEPPPPRRTLAQRLSRTPTKRFKMLGREQSERLVGPIARLLSPIQPAMPAILVLMLVLCVAGPVLGITSLGVVGPAGVGLWSTVIAMAVVLIGTAFHEFSHAVLCHVAGQPVREMGFALWYYFIPIAYVDRTDTYRVPDRVTRICISLAGPAHDMAWCAVLSLVVWTGLVDPHTFLGEVVISVIVFQVVGFFANFNPLLPTDGEQALEAALGLVNVRNRAMGYVADLVMRASGTLNRGPRDGVERISFILYGSACFIYVGLVAAMMLWSVISTGFMVIG